MAVTFLADISYTPTEVVRLAEIISVSMATALGAYIVNDIFDAHRDFKNSKYKSLWVENPLYSFCLFVGLTVASLIVSTKISQTFVISISLVILFCLWYSYVLKNTAFLGNLIAAGVTSYGLFVLYFLYPIDIYLILFFSLMSFFVNFNRELIKDIEDVVGDRLDGAKTLPIMMGMKKTLSFLKSGMLMTCILLGFYTFYLSKYYFFGPLRLVFILYVSVILMFPLFYCYYLIDTYGKRSNFRELSYFLKYVMLGGILMLCLF
ncbi:MAG: UbiA family prenyltransferase [Bacteroidota bacterium]|nr:UbiA family prenyltransferase [Bacteroidota bacterium]